MVILFDIYFSLFPYLLYTNKHESEFLPCCRNISFQIPPYLLLEFRLANCTKIKRSVGDNMERHKLIDRHWTYGLDFISGRF